MIELMVVVVILGIIAAVAIPSISNAINSAKVNTTVSDLATYQQALQRYYIDHGNYPTSFSALNQKSDATGNTGTGSADIYGPYLNYGTTQAINDAFGRSIYYGVVSVSGTDNGYYLLSGGTNSLSSPTSITSGDIYASNGQQAGVLSQTPITATGTVSIIGNPSFSAAQ